MLDYIKGQIEDLKDNSIVIESGCFGFNIIVSKNTIFKLKIGDIVKIYTYLSLSENDIKLYGFLDKSEKKVFEKLICVNGIGPKAAINVLSCCSPSQFLTYIVTDDLNSLTNIHGIGKKTAQRIVIELKDKVKNEEISYTLSSDKGSSDLMQALMSLGYSVSEITKILPDTDGMSLNDAIKHALKELS